MLVADFDLQLDRGRREKKESCCLFLADTIVKMKRWEARIRRG